MRGLECAAAVYEQDCQRAAVGTAALERGEHRAQPVTVEQAAIQRHDDAAHSIQHLTIGVAEVSREAPAQRDADHSPIGRHGEGQLVLGAEFAIVEVVELEAVKLAAADEIRHPLRRRVAGSREVSGERVLPDQFGEALPALGRGRAQRVDRIGDHDGARRRARDLVV